MCAVLHMCPFKLTHKGIGAQTAFHTLSYGGSSPSPHLHDTLSACILNHCLHFLLSNHMCSMPSTRPSLKSMSSLVCLILVSGSIPTQVDYPQDGTYGNYLSEPGILH